MTPERKILEESVQQIKANMQEYERKIAENKKETDIFYVKYKEMLDKANQLYGVYEYLLNKTTEEEIEYRLLNGRLKEEQNKLDVVVSKEEMGEQVESPSNKSAKSSSSKLVKSSSSKSAKRQKVDRETLKIAVEKVTQCEMTQIEACKLYSLNKSTLNRALNVQGIAKGSRPPPVNKIINNDMVVEAGIFVENSSSSSYKKIHQHLYDNNFGDLKVNIISTILKNLDTVWKETKLIPKKWNTQDIIEQRFEFANAMDKYADFEKIWVDKLFFNLDLVRKFGILEDTTVAYKTTHGKYLTSLTLVTAISSKRGVIHYELDNIVGLRKNGYNSEKFHNFLTNLIGIFEPNSKAVFIMGNTSIYNLSDEIKDSINKKGIEYIKLPAYSLFLNPMERFWKIIKTEIIKNENNKLDTLVENVEKVVNNATLMDRYKQYENKTLKYYPACIQRKEFTGVILSPDIETDSNLDDEVN
ncbi:hypothetical protein K502DRAFT_333077 [Neoconidiobolus thromboides FSU 785]|nr:hypothetical protein K502DRAFT_333077 [Neoconidiobolus thromboides FSU 785]